MQPPTQLLCAPRAFVGTLSLAPDSLKQHLTLLKQSVSSLEVAQQLARRNTGTLLMPYAERLLLNSGDVAQLLNISQVGTSAGGQEQRELYCQRALLSI